MIKTELFVATIGKKMVAKNRAIFWCTDNWLEAEHCKDEDTARKLAETVINVSKFPAEVLLPLVEVHKICIRSELV